MRSELLRERLNKKKGFLLVIKTFLIFARELYISY